MTREDFQGVSGCSIYYLTGLAVFPGVQKNHILTFGFVPHISLVLSDMGRDRRVIYSVLKDGVLRCCS
jgi:hypothetical protein